MLEKQKTSQPLEHVCVCGVSPYRAIITNSKLIIIIVVITDVIIIVAIMYHSLDDQRNSMATTATLKKHTHTVTELQRRTQAKLSSKC